MKKIKGLVVLGIIGMLSFMFSSQVKATAPDIKIDTLQGHVDTIKMAEESTGTSTEDIEKLKHKDFYSSAVALLDAWGPEVTTMNAQNLPVHMRRGLLGMAEDQVITMFNNQPNIDIIAHLSEQWIPGYNGAQSTYASGYDDMVKSGVTSLWSFTRNIAYLGFVIIMIVIGFMIMFRNKIGGQTLVTIGNTLPRVVVSLVLVTFSFAIAGILIDVCGILMSVISSSSVLGSGIPIDNLGELLKGSLGVVGLSSLGLGAIVGSIVLVLATTGATTGPVGVIAGSLVLIVLSLVIIGIIVVGAIKLWFALLKSYLSILINVITAPIAIMMGALPGNDASTINVFKSILRNALVFPVAFAIVNLPYFIEKQASVELGLPQTLTGSTGGATNVGPMILACTKIIAIYAAAQAPAMVLAIIPSTASKSGADAAGAIKAGLGKMPFIGGMFGK